MQTKSNEELVELLRKSATALKEESAAIEMLLEAVDPKLDPEYVAYVLTSLGKDLRAHALNALYTCEALDAVQAAFVREHLAKDGKDPDEAFKEAYLRMLRKALETPPAEPTEGEAEKGVNVVELFNHVKKNKPPTSN